MSRPPDHPSGAKETLCIRFAPYHKALLAELSRRREVDRNRYLEKLLESAAAAEERNGRPIEIVLETPQATGCEHPRTAIKASGIGTCLDCPAVRNAQGTWTP